MPLLHSAYIPEWREGRRPGVGGRPRTGRTEAVPGVRPSGASPGLPPPVTPPDSTRTLLPHRVLSHYAPVDGGRKTPIPNSLSLQVCV